MSALEAALMAMIISNAVDITRLDAGERAKVLILMSQLEDNLKQILSSGVLSDMGKQATNALLREVTALIQEAYTEAAIATHATAVTLAPIEANATYNAMQDVLTIMMGQRSKPNAAYLEKLASDVLIQGSPTADYWSKQAGDIAFRFAAQLRQGLVAGETNQQITARIIGTKDTPGVMAIARKNAAALVHSSVQTVANSARLATFKTNSDIIKGVKWVATLDSRTCPECAVRDGLSWDLEGAAMNGTDLPFAEPPLHIGCRCLLTPVMKTNKELGIDIPDLQTNNMGRASADGPVPGDTTFETWFAGRTEAQQNEQFGKGKATLFRAGKVTLRDLLDQSGNELTLAQLKAKHK